jgi:hypothetical protein
VKEKIKPIHLLPIKFLMTLYKKFAPHIKAVGEK